MPSATNNIAQAFKALHQQRGQPLVLTNVYDRLSAEVVASLPRTHALATASFAIARAAGMQDQDLDFETNLTAVQTIAAVAKHTDKPLTVDIQDGYGDALEENISRLIDLGVVGVNLEDVEMATGKLYPVSVAAKRVRRVLATAASRGVTDFVVNARCDTLVLGGQLDEVIERGKQYLEAGATNVFVWGGGRGLARVEVERLVAEFSGRLSVMLKRSSDGLTIEQLAHIGVSRVSIGPTLQIVALAALKSEAENILARA